MSIKPLNPDGEPNGAEPAEPLPEPSDALDEPRSPEPAALLAHLTGEPGTLPEVWCRKCEAKVKPEGKGRCPRCNAFLKLNFVARKHPVNVVRRQQLLNQLLTEYRPTTQRLQSICEQFASVTEQLETMKASGNTEHRGLVDLSLKLGLALEASRPAHPSAIDFGTLSTADLIARTTAILKQLVAQHDAEQSTYVPATKKSATPSDDDRAINADLAREAPVPELACAYCSRTAARCEELKMERLDVWQALHWNDPDEIERRRVEATRVMYATVGRGSGLTRW